MDFIRMPNVNTYNLPYTGTTVPSYGAGMIQQQQMNQPPMQQRIDPRQFDTPTIVSSHSAGVPKFTIIKDNDDQTFLPVDKDVPDMERRPKRQRKQESSDPAPAASCSSIIRAEAQSPEKVDGTVEKTPTAYTYLETTGMLRETLGQIDSLNAELMDEFTAVRHSRTMKNKYNVLVGISENVGSLLSNKIAAIREINSSISKSNELDYKINKDMKASMAAVDDDKYIADLYKSFISNPQMNVPPAQFNPVNNINPAVVGSGIIRADIGNEPIQPGGIVDANYLAFQANVTPEQHLMLMESNPNIQQVVVFDAANGSRFFQYMDMSNGRAIENMPTYDPMMMDEFTLDIQNKVAKSINLNETLPLIIINDNIKSQY